MVKKIFIDGEVGTTGLEIRQRLSGRNDIEILSLSEKWRKNKNARRERINSADIVILCLPDKTAIQAVAMIDDAKTRVIDASTAHRVANDWVYGFPEYEANHSKRIALANRVTNPGCYAIASVGILHPLIKHGVLPAEWPISINAISGYSGGGRDMINSFEKIGIGPHESSNVFFYGLTLEHKHLPEITHWAGLKNPPIFAPSVARYRKGMIIQVPITARSLPHQPKMDEIQEIYESYYKNCKFVEVSSIENNKGAKKLNPEELNGTNILRIHVYGNDKNGQIIVAGLLDNLGKGASGQVVQNLNLMIGVPESTGLI